jgi:hypothetical protein
MGRAKKEEREIGQQNYKIPDALAVAGPSCTVPLPLHPLVCCVHFRGCAREKGLALVLSHSDGPKRWRVLKFGVGPELAPERRHQWGLSVPGTS